MKVSQPQRICHMLDHKFRLNTHPTHNNLTFASRHTYKCLMMPLPCCRRHVNFLWLLSMRRMHVHLTCVVAFMCMHQKMQPSCIQCKAFVRSCAADPHWWAAFGPQAHVTMLLGRLFVLEQLLLVTNFSQYIMISPMDWPVFSWNRPLLIFIWVHMMRCCFRLIGVRELAISTILW